MNRLLLIVPNTSYRIDAFLAAAKHIDAEVAIATDEASTLEELVPDQLLSLDLTDLPAAVRRAEQFHRRNPVHAVVGVDDDGVLAAAAIAEALGFVHNSVASVAATRNKLVARQRSTEAGLPTPEFSAIPIHADPHRAAGECRYPVVLKPLFLSASRGVIRANNPDEFVRAFLRIRDLLQRPDVREKGGELAETLLVEAYLDGPEYSVEGLVTNGNLKVLALFDKPDSLTGPFFEETLYVTPSRAAPEVQQRIVQATARSAAALGLRHGPVHAEFRLVEQQPWLLEIAARSIGGLCSRIVQFSTNQSLEELILRHALGEPYEESPGPSANGVMMLPIPRAGRFEGVEGREQALAVPGIRQLQITVTKNQRLVPLPEGSEYLGFLFAQAETPDAVEKALRAGHRALQFRVRENS